MIDLTGKIAIVTGGSRGIGRAIALRLATQGADIAFSYRGNEAAAGQTAREIEALGRRALAVQGDVTDPDTADHLVKGAEAHLGQKLAHLFGNEEEVVDHVLGQALEALP